VDLVTHNKPIHKKTFQGFTETGISFLIDLERNNHVHWFYRHLEVYYKHLIGPAEKLEEALLYRIQTHLYEQDIPLDLKCTIEAIKQDSPKPGSSQPAYKPQMALRFSPGESEHYPCFYICITPKHLFLKGGVFHFSSSQLAYFRESILDPISLRCLAFVLKESIKRGAYTVNGSTLDETPEGYSHVVEPHPLIKHTGLWLTLKTPLPVNLYSAHFSDYCFVHFRKMTKLLKWLHNNLP
jgi:uncharacterized protein (DUF2461 family)